MKYDFGVVKELKEGETRVSITPDVVAMLQSDGLSVLIESDAGVLSGFSNEDYINNGATVVKNAKEVWDNSKIIVKVKEPQESEYQYFRPDLIIFSYLHLAVEEKLTSELLKKKVTAIASEAIKTKDGQLPLLTPMSEVAGRLAVQMGANYLQSQNGGSGVLLSGVPGVQPGKVIIIGAGVVGFNAAQTAIGMGADVSIFDINPKKLVQIDGIYGTSIKTHYCNPAKITQEVPKADLLITCVLKPSHVAPKIVPEEVVKMMKKGSVIVDVAIDQGGIVETIDKVTTHSNPVFEKHGVIHYSVANIPGAVAHTSTLALTNATLPYLLKIADNGFINAIKKDYALEKGVNTYKGEIVKREVAQALDMKHSELSMLVGF